MDETTTTERLWLFCADGEHLSCAGEAQLVRNGGLSRCPCECHKWNAAPQPEPDAGEWAIYDSDGVTSGTLEYIRQRHPDAIGISTPQPPFGWGRTGIIVIPQDGKLEEARQMAVQIVTDHTRAALVPKLVEALNELIKRAEFALSTPGLIRGRDELKNAKDAALALVKGRE